MKLPHLDYHRFSTAFEPGEFWYAQLWARDGRRGSCIRISKVVWMKVGDAGSKRRWRDADLRDRDRYVVFFVYTDPLSPRAIPHTGGKINAEPIVNLAKAMKLARAEAAKMKAWDGDGDAGKRWKVITTNIGADKPVKPRKIRKATTVAALAAASEMLLRIRREKPERLTKQSKKSYDKAK